MPGVIDGRRWLRQRIEHLETMLGRDLPPDQRQLMEAELERARSELRRLRWRWLFRGTGY